MDLFIRSIDEGLVTGLCDCLVQQFEGVRFEPDFIWRATELHPPIAFVDDG